MRAIIVLLLVLSFATGCDYGLGAEDSVAVVNSKKKEEGCLARYDHSFYADPSSPQNESVYFGSICLQTDVDAEGEYFYMDWWVVASVRNLGSGVVVDQSIMTKFYVNDVLVGSERTFGPGDPVPTKPCIYPFVTAGQVVSGPSETQRIQSAGTSDNPGICNTVRGDFVWDKLRLYVDDEIRIESFFDASWDGGELHQSHVTEFLIRPVMMGA